jgi:hypothetical protein
MSPIWRSLEIVGSDALTLPHWQKGFGADDLALLRPFLSPRTHTASTQPCVNTFSGHDCRYRIVTHTGAHDHTTHIGVCDEGRCEKRSFTTADLVLYRFNDSKLSAAIATALGLQPFAAACPTTASSTPAKVLPIATLCGDDGRTAPVVLIRTRAPEAALDQLTLNLVAKPIILFPTAADLTPAVEARLHRYGWPYRVLENLLFFRPTGIIATADAADSIAEMAESLIGEVPKAAFAVPVGTRWGEITLTFNSNDHQVANVLVRGVRHRITPHDLGLLDARTQRPDRQWLFLEQLAECGGHFGWIDAKKHVAAKKIKLRLSQALRRAFGIKTEPIEWRRDDKAWVTEFSISQK